MLYFKNRKFVSLGILFVFVMFFGAGLSLAQNPPATKAAAPAENAASTVTSVPKTVATVNGEEISYQQLSQACVKDYGMDVLQRLLTRLILEMACKNADIVVTEDDLRQEVSATATRFGVTMEQYLALIERERGISPAMLIQDGIWPQVAVKKLAGREAVPTEAEIKIEFERRHGPAVKARLIAAKTKENALKLRAEALKDVSQFPELAQKYSTDPYTASLGGVVPPIRRHLNGEEFEKIVFALKPGEISQPIPVADQFLLILCEEQMPQDPTIKLAGVRSELEQIVQQGKINEAGMKLSQKLEAEAQIDIYLGDPAKSAARPGVAAMVGKKVISIAKLGDECVVRHGKEALEGLINRALIVQAIKKAKIRITEEDMDKEVAKIALENIPPKTDGSPNVEVFLDLILKKHGATPERYRNDVVWPTLALMKLVEGKVKVTEEDLQRGYTANFGKKVECRVIVLNDLRTAQRVWAMARENATEDHFIELAKKFSADPGSQNLGGKIPPISQYGGQPELEKEAFKLAEGELSGIIQMNNVYLILLCLGQTEPIGVTFEETKDLIEKNIREMKLQDAIGEKFEDLKAQAAIDNYLTGSTKPPAEKKAPEVK